MAFSFPSQHMSSIVSLLFLSWYRNSTKCRKSFFIPWSAADC